MATEKSLRGASPAGGACPPGAADAAVEGQMFKSLAEHSLEFIGMCDLEFQPFYVNPAGRRLVGLASLEEACAVRVQDFFFPEDQRFIREEFLPKVLREGAGEVEIRFRHFKTGAALWMIYNVFQVRDARGQVSGYATVSRDITRRKQAEAIEERLRTLLDHNPSLVFMKDEAGRYVYLNQAYERWFVHSKEWPGKTDFDFWPKEAAELFRKDDTEVLRCNETKQFLEDSRDLTGKRHCWLCYKFPFTGADGKRYVGGVGIDATGQIEAEEERQRLLNEVERERARLEAVLEALPVGVWVADASGKMILVNQAAAKMFGGQAPAVEEIGEYGVYQVWWPGTSERVRIEDFPLVRALRGEVVHDMVMEREVADGARGSHVASANPIRDAAGNIVGAVVIAMDITPQKQAEAALRESQERRGYLLHLADALRRLTDPVQVQEAAARVLGEQLGAGRVLYFEVRDPDYVVERDYTQGLPPLRGTYPIAAFGPKLVEAYRAGRTVVVKDVRTEPSLSPAEREAYTAIQIRAHVGVPLVKGGRLVAGLAVHADGPREWTAQEIRLIEETAERTWAAVRRARAEEALRESEERLKQAIGVAGLGTFEHDLRSGVLRYSPLMRELMGFGPGEQPSLAEVKQRVAPEDRERFEAAIEKAQDPAGDGALELEHRVANPKGGVRWISVRAQTFFEGEGSERRAVRTLGAALDVTAQKDLQAELERLVAERTGKLQELVGELEHFSYTITHDLKSPLRAMRGFAEMASMACEESGGRGAKEFLDRIGTSAERMDRLIADALNYSRAVRQELPLENVDTGALLRGMLDSYPELQPSRARIRVEGRLPVVLANPAGLTQVFSNLLENAVKFVKPGEKPDIRVWSQGEAQAPECRVQEGTPAAQTEVESGWVKISVEDSGIGIARGMLPRVFDMFSRGSKDFEGTGIGLALVRKVVQRMGGKVGVESEEGKGSRFWFELKCGESRGGGMLTRPAPAEGTGDQGTVLYVEDEESDAMFMGRAFEEKGLSGKLQVVADGRAAIEYLSGSGKYGDREKHPAPALVLLDLNLPQVGGFEVLKWMRNNPDFARTPVVVFSSSTREDDRVRAKELGANEFVAKPGSGLKFGQVVEGLRERWLGKARNGKTV